jgi:hypothetical protein
MTEHDLAVIKYTHSDNRLQCGRCGAEMIESPREDGAAGRWAYVDVFIRFPPHCHCWVRPPCEATAAPEVIENE